MTVAQLEPFLGTYTVHDAIEAIGFGRFQTMLSLVTGLAWMAESMEIMLLSLLTPSLVCEWGITPFQQSMGVSCVFIGWMVASPFWGWFFDTYGRRTGLFLSTMAGSLLGLATAASPSFPAFVVIRGLAGAALGGVPQSATIYTEFLPTHARAKCIILLEVFFALGAAVEAGMAVFIMPVWGWRGLVICSSIPLGIASICCAWLPESPRYLISHGRTHDAFVVLKRVARTNRKELPDGDLTNEHDASKKAAKVWDLLCSKLRRTTILLWIIWALNAFLYYGVALFTTKMVQSTDVCHGGDPNANVTIGAGGVVCRHLTNDDYLEILKTSIAELPGLLLTVLIIDRLGRKKTLAVQFLFYSVAILTLYFCHPRSTITNMLFVARALISGSFQSAYVYTPEVFPTTLRALGIGTSSMFARIGSIASPMVAQIVADFSIVAAVLVYAVGGLLGAIASMLLPIETAGMELKDTLH